MEKKVIRVGSVGVGAIWGGVHEPGIAKSPDLTLVAICDIDEKKLEAVGEKYGIPPQYRFTDYRDLVNCDIVDAVDICTSNDAHFKVAMAAVEAGKPFNLEKPITLTAEEADILAKAAQEKNVKNMVCFSYRFKAAARYAKDLPCNAPCVIANGAAIYDFRANEYLYTAFLGEAIYDHMAEVLARFPTLAFEVYHDDRRIHAMNPNRYIRNHEHLTRSPVQVVERFTDIDLPIIKILFEEDFPVLDAVRTFILSRPWGREYELIYSNEHLLELTAAGATKGGMILRLASLLGVARKDIYCIGDHKNDIPMLEVSAVPFAPVNAIPAVHEFGAHIVSHCSDGAVADVVEYLDKIY